MLEIHFRIVPRCFVETVDQDLKCDYSVPMMNSLGHYCMKNEKCRKIVHFLTLSGKHNVRANIEVMYQDAIMSYGNSHVKTFDEIVDDVLYQVFEKRFANKDMYLKNTTFVNVFGTKTINDKSSYKRIEKVKAIIDEEDCLNDGPDCTTAILILDSTLNRLYRVLAVLNKGNLASNRNYGTLMANVISELDPKGRKSLKEKKDVVVAFSKLQVELKTLFSGNNSK